MQSLTSSIQTVLTLLLVGGAGTVLARRKVFTPATAHGLSQIVYRLMLPCLLFTSILESVSISSLMRWWVIPALSFGYIAAGFVVGGIIAAVVRPPAAFRRGMIASVAFANSGYAPLSIIAALGPQALDLFGGRPAVAEGIAYISLFLIVYSPMTWIFGYQYLAHHKSQERWTSRIFTPPTGAVLAALVLGLIPWTRALFVGADAPLRTVFDAAGILGKAVVPCILLMIGVDLAEGPKAEHVDTKTVTGSCVGRFLLFPLIAFPAVLLLRRFGLIESRMMLFVLLIESFMPVAVNLTLIHRILGHHEKEMASVTFWQYLVAVPAMAVWISIALAVI